MVELLKNNDVRQGKKVQQNNKKESRKFTLNYLNRQNPLKININFAAQSTFNSQEK